MASFIPSLSGGGLSFGGLVQGGTVATRLPSDPPLTFGTSASSGSILSKLPFNLGTAVSRDTRNVGGVYDDAILRTARNSGTPTMTTAPNQVAVPTIDPSASNTSFFSELTRGILGVAVAREANRSNAATSYEVIPAGWQDPRYADSGIDTNMLILGAAGIGLAWMLLK